MSFFRHKNAKGPPPGYIPGLGRGAAGFTTRSDLAGGNTAAAAAATTTTAEDSGTGSRAAQARKAVAFATAVTATAAAPGKYIPARGRGEKDDNEPPTVQGQYDDDDDQADAVWAAIDERMNRKRKRKADQSGGHDDDNNDNYNNEDNANTNNTSRARIGAQFRELKEQLQTVTEDEWLSIPDVGDHSLRYKQSKRQDIFTPLTDSLLEQRHGNKNAPAVSGTTVAYDDVHNEKSGNSSGYKTTVANMSGLSAARGTVLEMSLDKMTAAAAAAADASTTGGKATTLKTATNAVDAEGYLTSLASISQSNPAMAAGAANVADINKARLLLKSVRDTNPHHGPGWIAAARVEEAAGKTLQARKIMQEACQVCPHHEDVWLEAARLHTANAKSILATAARRIPTSVKIFLKAADLEQTDAGKKAVLRKGLEANPTSVTLWKAAIELEDAADARVLLSVAVEKIPHSVDMWLALARLETYQNAQKVLNKARKALPAERSIWIAAAKLEESQNHNDVVDKVIERAVKSLQKNEAVVTREQWLHEAEQAEAADAPLTSAAIVKYTIGIQVDAEDRQRTWSEDAKATMARGSIATARAILSHALAAFPTKRTLWMQAVDLERKHGTADTLDEVLAAASERLPHIEIFWLLRAKERWLGGHVDMAREILTKAFAANPESEAVWLAAAKLEWEIGETDRARYFLQKARERAPTDRVFMKSALLEREEGKFDDALKLIEEGIGKYPTFAKLYMMGGQICSDNLPKQKTNLDRARKFYERGLQQCPQNAVLWIHASRLEERASSFEGNGEGAATKSASGATKARSLLELARLKNPKTPLLWLEAIRLERRAGHPKSAETLMAKALQECPTAGILLAENISTAPRAEQKSKAAIGIKRCPDDPVVICAVASLFASERKYDKARKWFDRAATLNADLGDTWARYYAFELKVGTKEQQEAVKQRCVAAEPRHGELWAATMKDMANRKKSVAEGLELVAQLVLSQKNSASSA